MSMDADENPAPDEPAVAHFHECEFSSTGYFGNEGSDTDFYLYAALHLSIPAVEGGIRKPKQDKPAMRVTVVAAPPKRRQRTSRRPL